MAKERGKDREVLRIVYSLMAKGWTTTEIADHLGIRQPEVSRMAQKKNLHVAIRMMQMADEGYTLEEIGKTFGVTKQRVSQLIGREKRRGSTGKLVQLDADPKTWEAMERVASALDIPVRNYRGIDTRAIVVLMDGIRSGEYQVGFGPNHPRSKRPSSG